MSSILVGTTDINLKPALAYTVYAICSKVDCRIYVGFTDSIARRLGEHTDGKTKSTKGYVPWLLTYSENASGRQEARNRERYLKSGCGKEFLKSVGDGLVP